MDILTALKIIKYNCAEHDDSNCPDFLWCLAHKGRVEISTEEWNKFKLMAGGYDKAECPHCGKSIVEERIEDE